MRNCIWALLVTCILSSSSVSAQEAKDAEANLLIRQVVWDALDSRSSSVQTEVPTMGTTTTAIVDGASVAKFVSIALNIGQLSGGTGGSDDKTSASATVTGLAFAQAACSILCNGVDLDNGDARFTKPVQHLRNLGITLGFDEREEGSDGRILYGLRYKLDGFWRSPPTSGTEQASTFAIQPSELVKALEAAAQGDTNDERRDQIRMVLRHASKGGGLHSSASGSLANMDTTIAIARLVRKVRRENFFQNGRIPEDDKEPPRWYTGLTAAVDFKGVEDRDGSEDEYAATAVVEWLPPQNPQTLVRFNAGFLYEEISDDDDAAGGDVALEFKHEFGSDDRVAGTSPVSMSIAGRAKWLSGDADQYVGQAKLSIPIVDGVSLPLSATIANRTEFVDETEVRGILGFTVDTSRLAQVFQP